VLIHYQKFGTEEPLEYYVFPYALKEWRSRWYLLGMTKGKETLKAFGLDRIVRIQEQSGHFTPREIDINELYKDCYGIYNEESAQVEEIILSYNLHDGEYVKSQPIHHSQEILPESKNQNRLFIKLKLKITKEFQLEILARGFSLQVHKPESLRKAIHKIYQDGMKANEFGVPLLF
nr:WYL domain-containing protein [Odoribacter sp.]